MIAVTKKISDNQNIILQGMGGMGKSALMSHWVHKASKDKVSDAKFDNIIYVDCSNDIETGFLTDINLLEKLGIKQLATDDSINKLDKIITVLEDLSNLLLVLDDLPANESVIDKAYQQVTQLSSIPCSIIATSRSKDYDQFHSIEIDALSERKCIELFLSHSKLSIDSTDPNVKRIINLSGKHTLTIELLGKTAYKRRFGASQLLEILLQQNFEIETPVRYTKDFNSANESINIALAKLFVIAHLNDNQHYILYHMALMDSQVVTFELLDKWLTSVNSSDTSVLMSLVDSGWVKLIILDPDKQHTNEHYYLHQVISHAIRTHFCMQYNNKNRSKFIQPVVKNLEEHYQKFNSQDIVTEPNFKQQPNDNTNLQIYEQINQACFPAVAAYISNSINITKRPMYLESLITTLNNFTLFCINKALYTLGISTVERCFTSIDKLLRDSNPYFITSLSNLAGLYVSVGNYKKALPIFKKVVNIRKGSLSEFHIKYAISLNNLAGLHQIMGNYEKALPLSKQSLKITKHNLSETHPDYGQALNNLGLIYQKIGNYEEALPLYQQALEIRKNSLGETHPMYATSLNNLASLFEDIGDYQQALPLYKQSLEIIRQSLGEMHPDYAIPLINLGNLLESMGDYKQAQTMYEQALNVIEKSLGDTHPIYATSLNNLADLYVSMANYQQALPLYLQSLEIIKHSLGEMYPDYGANLSNLATLYKNTGDYEQALILYKKAHEIVKKSLGEKHPYYATSLNNLALIFDNMGDHEQALLLCEEAIEITKKNFGEMHPKYAISLNNLASLYTSTDRYEQALPLYQQAHDILKENLGEIHSDTQSIRMNYLDAKAKCD